MFDWLTVIFLIDKGVAKGSSSFTDHSKVALAWRQVRKKHEGVSEPISSPIVLHESSSVLLSLAIGLRKFGCLRS